MRLILLPLATLCGCASITDGTDQTLIIPVQPREARCSVTRDTVELGTITGTQQSIRVSKGAKDIIIECTAPGYLPKTGRLVSTTQAAGMMSVLFIDFGITDMITGAMWKYPTSMNIVMERDPNAQPVAGSAATAQPRAAQVVLSDEPKPQAKTPPPQLKDTYMAERYARDIGCVDGPATLVGRGPGQESYSFQCTNGDTMVVQCQWGNCRALK